MWKYDEECSKPEPTTKPRQLRRVPAAWWLAVALTWVATWATALVLMRRVQVLEARLASLNSDFDGLEDEVAVAAAAAGDDGKKANATASVSQNATKHNTTIDSNATNASSPIEHEIDEVDDVAFRLNATASALAELERETEAAIDELRSVDDATALWMNATGMALADMERETEAAIVELRRVDDSTVLWLNGTASALADLKRETAVTLDELRVVDDDAAMRLNATMSAIEELRVVDMDTALRLNATTSTIVDLERETGLAIEQLLSVDDDTALRLNETVSALAGLERETEAAIESLLVVDDDTALRQNATALALAELEETTGVAIEELRGVNNDTESRLNATASSLAELKRETRAAIDELRLIASRLGRGMASATTAREQAARLWGGSGMLKVREYGTALDAYNEAAWTNFGSANIHSHANHERTIGLGEVAARLNGVDFVTRHNDYPLRTPVSGAYHKVEDIEFPDVPPEVLNKSTVEEQIIEMREWYRAFHLQDSSIRPYQEYFPAVLCALEGAWVEDETYIDEANFFESDRHELEAETWDELHAKNEFLFMSGKKNGAENLAYLPSAIRGVKGDDWAKPVMSNFEYRIVCTKIDEEVPTARFRVADDLHVMLSEPAKLESMAESRRARFDVNPAPTDEWEGASTPWSTRNQIRTYMDELMAKLPGKDGPDADLRDDSLFDPTIDIIKNQPLNAAYYSRVYGVDSNDAMGRSQRKRGFNDGAFSALTTHERVSSESYCEPATAKRNETCWTQRYSWAIPLEIIYLHPLHSWNPHELEYFAGDKTGPTTCPGATCDGKSLETPLQGYSRQRWWYKTPADFFSNETDVSNDAADTDIEKVAILDGNGTAVWMTASGIRIMLDTIPGVGRIRTRYPIFPLAESHTAAWKEIKALTTLGVDGNLDLADFVHPRALTAARFYLSPSSGHDHYFDLDSEKYARLLSGEPQIRVAATTPGAGHTHKLWITKNPDTGAIDIDWCAYGTACSWLDKDAGNCVSGMCPDGHTTVTLFSASLE